MSNDLTPIRFANDEFDLSFRPDGTGGFRIAAAEVARFLGFTAARDMLRTVPEDQKGWEVAPTPGGDQHIWFLTLPGFFRVLGQRQTSRIKDVEVRGMVARFQSWNFGEVLPSIAATGSYSAAPPAPSTDIAERVSRRELALMILEAEDAREVAETRAVEAETRAAELEGPARAWHGLADGDTTGVSMRAASKELRAAGARIGDREFPGWLAGQGLIYRAGGVGAWLPKKTAEDRGLIALKRSTGTHKGSDGTVKPNDPSVRILAHGMEHILGVLLAERGSTRTTPGQTMPQLVVAG